MISKVKFCRKCGESIKENSLYCKSCGTYVEMKPKQINSIEDTNKFCRNCGNKVEKRYCSNCGTFNMITKETDTINHGSNVTATPGYSSNHTGGTSSFTNNTAEKSNDLGLGGVVKTGSQFIKNNTFINQEAVPYIKTNYKELLKNAGVFAAIMLIISFIFTCALNQLFMEFIKKEIYYGSTLGVSNALNLKLFVYSMLYGGKTQYSFNFGNSMQVGFGVLLPYWILIFTILFIFLSDKIRYAVTKVKRNVYNCIAMALGNAVVTSLVLVFMQKKTMISKTLFEVLTQILPLSLADELFSNSMLSYDISERIIFKSSVPIFEMLLISFIITLAVLFILTVSETVSVRLAKLKNLISYTMGLVFLTALVPSVVTVFKLRSLSYGALDPLTMLLFLFPLFGVYLTALLTGKFSVINVVMDSTTISELKLNIFRVQGSTYGYEDSISSPFKLIFIGLLLLGILIILYCSLQLWKQYEGKMKGVLIESALFSFGFSIIAAVFTRLAVFGIQASLKPNKGYDTSALVGNMPNNLEFMVGPSSFIGTICNIFIVVFIIILIGYAIVKYQPTFVAKIYAVKRSTVTIVFCIAIILISLGVNNTFSMDNIEEFGYLLDNIVNSIGF